MKNLKRWAIIFSFLFCCSIAYAQEKKILQIGAGDTGTAILDGYEAFFKQAYAEIGYDVKIVKLPLKRMVEEAESGRVDGLIFMPKQTLNSTKNLILVPTAITQTDVSVFSKEKDFKVAGPASLKPYKIGYIRGYPVTEQLTTGLDRYMVDSFESLFKMIQAGHIDVGLVMRAEALRFLQGKSEYKDIKMLTPPFFSIPLHHMLNKKHEALVPKINPIIEKLINDGVLKKLLAPYQM